MGASDEFCNVYKSTAARKLGPYFKKMPVNPLNGLSTILIVPNGSSLPPAGLPDNSTGWMYKPQTLELIPNSPGNDSEGTPYVEY